MYSVPVSHITQHSIKLMMACACRNMFLKIVVRFFQYLSLLQLLRFYDLRIMSNGFAQRLILLQQF